MSVTERQTRHKTNRTIDTHNPSEPTLDQTGSMREFVRSVYNADLTHLERGLVTLDRLDRETQTEAPIVGLIQKIGAAIIAAFMIIVVLSQVYNLEIIQNGNGPFGNLTSKYVTYGTAALTIVGIGLIIYAAGFAMNAFGGWGSTGR